MFDRNRYLCPHNSYRACTLSGMWLLGNLMFFPNTYLVDLQ